MPDTIESAVDDVRGNEGEFHCRGPICAPLPEERCAEPGPDLMMNNETAFTVSVDLPGHGCTAGLPALDRSKTKIPVPRSHRTTLPVHA